jgi:hypothetical protein
MGLRTCAIILPAFQGQAAAVCSAFIVISRRLLPSLALPSIPVVNLQAKQKEWSNGKVR